MVDANAGDTLERIMARKVERVNKLKDAKTTREENGIVNRLLIETLPMGLYRCRYELGGPVPTEFDGVFTSMHKLQQMATRRWGNTDKLKVA